MSEIWEIDQVAEGFSYLAIGLLGFAFVGVVAVVVQLALDDESRRLERCRKLYWGVPAMLCEVVFASALWIFVAAAKSVERQAVLAVVAGAVFALGLAHMFQCIALLADALRPDGRPGNYRNLMRSTVYSMRAAMVASGCVVAYAVDIARDVVEPGRPLWHMWLRVGLVVAIPPAIARCGGRVEAPDEAARRPS